MASYINIKGKRIFLDDGQTVALTRQVNTFDSMKTRQANLTNTLKALIIGKNAEALEWLHIPGSDSRLPYGETVCSLMQNGSQVIKDGKLVVKNVTDKEAELIVYWGNSDFFERLNFNLRELNLATLNHLYNQNVVLYGNNLNNEVFWCFANFLDDVEMPALTQFLGVQNQNVIQLNVENAFASIRFKTVLDAIFQHIDFTYKGDFIDSAEFGRTALVLPSKRWKLNNKSDFFIKAQNTVYENVALGLWKVRFNAIEKDLKSAIFGGGSLNQSMIANKTGSETTLKIRLSFKGKWEKGETNTTPFRLTCEVGRVTGPGTVTVPYRVEFEAEESESFTNAVYEFDTKLAKDEYFSIYVRPVPPDSVFTYIPGTELEVIDIDTNVLPLGETFDVAHNIPDVTAFDFVTAMMRMFGLIINTESSHVQFLQFGEIVGQQSTPWQYRNAKGWTRDFIPGNYAKENEVKYSNQIQTAFFNIDNVQLPAQAVAIDIPALLPEVISSRLIGSILDFKIKDDLTKIHVLQTETRNAEAGQLEYLVKAGTGSKFETRVQWGIITGLTPQWIIDNYYPEWIEILKDFSRFTIEVYFNEDEFNGVELLKPYYVKELGCNVLVEKMGNFVAGKPTQVQLIKI